ncbi:hypothetical protein IAU60_001913 [Kwoniella sp. DSM 27419]
MSQVTDKPTGKLTLAFFKCDSLQKESIEKHGEYQDVIHNLFEPLLPKHLELETLSFDVMKKREYPSDEQLKHIDAIIISGSFEDEAHADTRWILKLAGYLIKIYMMQQIHSDIVTEVPDDFYLLGTSEKCPVQGIAAFYPDDKRPPAFTHSEAHTLPSEPWSRVHIIAFQGEHEDILVPFIDNYEQKGTFDAKFAEEARENSRKQHDGERLGKVLLRVLGVA